MRADGSGIDPGLLERFRASGREISWRAAPASGKGRPARARGRSRIAHLNDEDARIEETTTPTGGFLRVDSGPVGALVLVLALDERGPPTAIRALGATDDPRFPGGAIEAQWGGVADPAPGPAVRDLVALARYALA